MDPPEEYGVAVNFGTTNTGKGSRPLSNLIQAEPDKAEPKWLNKTGGTIIKTLEKSEKVLTQDN